MTQEQRSDMLKRFGAFLSVSAFILFTWLFVGAGTLILKEAMRNQLAAAFGVVIAAAFGVGTIVVCMGFAVWVIHLYRHYDREESVSAREARSTVTDVMTSMGCALFVNSVPVFGVVWLSKQHLWTAGLTILLIAFALALGSFICRGVWLIQGNRDL